MLTSHTLLPQYFSLKDSTRDFVYTQLMHHTPRDSNHVHKRERIRRIWVEEGPSIYFSLGNAKRGSCTYWCRNGFYRRCIYLVIFDATWEKQRAVYGYRKATESGRIRQRNVISSTVRDSRSMENVRACGSRLNDGSRSLGSVTHAHDEGENPVGHPGDVCLRLSHGNAD